MNNEGAEYLALLNGAGVQLAGGGVEEDQRLDDRADVAVVIAAGGVVPSKRVNEWRGNIHLTSELSAPGVRANEVIAAALSRLLVGLGGESRSRRLETRGGVVILLLLLVLALVRACLTQTVAAAVPLAALVHAHCHVVDLLEAFLKQIADVA